MDDQTFSIQWRGLWAELYNQSQLSWISPTQVNDAENKAYALLREIVKEEQQELKRVDEYSQKLEASCEEKDRLIEHLYERLEDA